ncbi:MAG: LPS assembly lipoprotein LptE [Gammaproteobacteria bacterium]
MKQWLTKTGLLVMLFFLAACGFQLRGSLNMPPLMLKTFVKSDAPYASMPTAMRKELLSAGVVVPSSNDNATAVIQILNHHSDKRLLSVGSSGKATEYELFEAIGFRLLDAHNKVVIERQDLRITRDYVFDETRLLGEFEEAEHIRRQMQQELAKRVLKRIEVRLKQNGTVLPQSPN